VKLLPEWKLILKKAWSIRLLVVAGLLSGVEVALPFLVDSFPRGLFAVLSLVFTASAFVARLVAQQSIQHE